jgi:serine phosphatase RsbU (regulator of sigma subunit)/Flp pilus assembly protein TadD
MKLFIKYALIVFSIGLFATVNAKDPDLDSLKLVLKNITPDDTNRMCVLDAMADIAPDGEWEIYSEEMGRLAQKFITSRDPAVKKAGKRYYSVSINNKAVIFVEKGDYATALDYYAQCLKVNRELGDKKNMALFLSNIGVIYDRQGDVDNAMKNYRMVLALQKEIGSSKDMIATLNNMGVIYDKINQPDSAFFAFMQALEIADQEIFKSNTVTTLLSNIGSSHENKGDLNNAMKYYYRGLKMSEDLNDNIGKSNNLIGLATVSLRRNEPNKAMEYAKQAVSASKVANNLKTLIQAAGTLKGIYEKQGKYKEAYKIFQLEVSTRDTLERRENQIAVIRHQFKNEYDIKEATAKAEQEKINIIAQKELQKQKIIILFVGLGLLLVLVFAVFLFRSLKVRNKQNKIILDQKSMLEEKQKEILDSIEYALRIQTAILPPHKIVKQFLENSFILYKPKDIVAGDFYWMETINDLVLFAACDCTGHGVPGAMVSVVCHNALNRAVREFGLTEPAAILDKTAEIVVENFSKSEEDIKDGMDISLCAYNTKTKKVQWAGANNPIWLIQNGEIIETKADKQPIGMNEDSKPFTSHTFNLKDGDTIYLFTDGFADQFGGITGQKKLTKKRFKDLILSIQNKSLEEQGIELDDFLTEYRKEIEQIDDILVMGVRI